MRTAHQTENRTLTLKCHHGEVDRLHQFLRDTMINILGNRADTELISKIVLAVHEAFTNVVHHAYPGGKKEEVFIYCDSVGKGIAVELVDHGLQFNPLESSQVFDTKIINEIQSIEDLCELDEEAIRGGYGIPIIQATTTSAEYWRSESGDNHLYMYFEE